MKRITIAIAVAALALPAIADTYVQGYFKKDGTYVQGHYKTEPNSTKLDNYSTRGNVNPYTSEPGYVDPYAPKKSRNTYDPTYEYKPYSYEPVKPKKYY